MDKNLISKKFACSVETYSEEAVAQQQIAQKMAGLLRQYVCAPAINQVVEFGCGTGLYSKLLVDLYGEQSLIVNDICPDMLDYFHRHVNAHIRLLPGDAEKMHLPCATSLITSCSAIQWFEDPDTFFKNSISSLSQGGYLAFSTFGPDNVKEVSRLTGRGLRYLSLHELEHKLKPHYEICYAAEERLTYTFPSSMDVLRHLKRTGVTGLGERPMSRAELGSFNRAYESKYKTKDGVYLTYHPIYIIAKKKNLK